MKYRLLAAIVPHGESDGIAAAAAAAGSGGGTVVAANGTAPNAIMQLLGLGAGGKEIYWTVAGEDVEERVRAVLEAAAKERKGAFGVLFDLPVRVFARFGIDELPAALSQASGTADSSGTQDTTQQTMQDNQETELVAFVVNKGFADDAMAAARRAGAKGGTVVKARGTAKPGDETFFGVPLVPEKEMLVVVAPKAVTSAVFEAVRALPCFSVRGSGIAFTLPVSSFASLGSGS